MFVSFHWSLVLFCVNRILIALLFVSWWFRGDESLLSGWFLEKKIVLLSLLLVLENLVV